jgi:hypothetical protein
MTLGLLINTCQSYFSNIPNVINNIEACNFPKENVVIVSGQENENSIEYINKIKVVKVDYTGLHLTSIIYMSENIHLFKHINYWLILPDTIKLEKLFYVKIMKYYDLYLKNKEINCLPFINPKVRPTMDMGILHINQVINISNYLNKIKKVPPYDINDIIKLKRQLIYDENTILGLPASVDSLATKFKFISSKNSPPTKFIVNYNTQLIEQTITINNILINEVSILHLDFYKYQRNFGGPDVDYVMNL